MFNSRGARAPPAPPVPPPLMTHAAFYYYFRRHSQQVRDVVQELQSNAIREQENVPLAQQPWFAGPLNVKTATDRLDSLPIGTFMIRQRDNGQYALM